MSVGGCRCFAMRLLVAAVLVLVEGSATPRLVQLGIASEQRRRPWAGDSAYPDTVVFHGQVVQEDGSQLPGQVMTELTCDGAVRVESSTDLTGWFSLEMVDRFGFDAASHQESMFGRNPRTCALRVSLPGYRLHTFRFVISGSSVVNVGKIVLHPLIAKERSTTVTAASMRAPKSAKKALEKAERALRKQNYSVVEKSLRSALELYPDYVEAWLALAQLYQRQQRVEDARTACNRAITSDPLNASPYLELARLAAGEKNWPQVVQYTDRALALNPLDSPYGFFLNALAHWELRDYEASERSAWKAQRLDAAHKIPLVYVLLGDLLHERGDYQGSAEQLRLFLRAFPKSPDADKVRTQVQQLDQLLSSNK